jgi:hypothetical protein
MDQDDLPAIIEVAIRETLWTPGSPQTPHDTFLYSARPPVDPNCDCHPTYGKLAPYSLDLIRDSDDTPQGTKQAALPPYSPSSSMTPPALVDLDNDRHPSIDLSRGFDDTADDARPAAEPPLSSPTAVTPGRKKPLGKESLPG